MVSVEEDASESGTGSSGNMRSGKQSTTTLSVLLLAFSPINRGLIITPACSFYMCFLDETVDDLTTTLQHNVLLFESVVMFYLSGWFYSDTFLKEMISVNCVKTLFC